MRAHTDVTIPNLRRSHPAGVTLRAGTVAGRTHVGRVRERNEDHFLAVDVVRTLEVRASSLDPAPSLEPSRGTILVVADGMGGYGDGELASAVVVDELVAHFARHTEWAATHAGRLEALQQEFQAAVEACQRRVQREAERRAVDPRMGTTLTVAYLLSDRVFVAHVGDSRAYVYRPGQGLFRVTHDHTLGELLRQQGVDPTGREGILTQAVGGGPDTPRIEWYETELFQGDRLLLCTDGVTAFLEDPQLASIVGASSSPTEAADAVVAAVLATEAADNLTVVIAEVDGAAPARPEPGLAE